MNLIHQDPEAIDEILLAMPQDEQIVCRNPLCPGALKISRPIYYLGFIDGLSAALKSVPRLNRK